jgi:hypothetical protein
MAGMPVGTFGLADSSSWAPLQTLLNCNATLVRFALKDVSIGIDCARIISGVRSTADFDEAVINYTRDRFDALAETVAELSSQMQNNLAESDANITLGFCD